MNVYFLFIILSSLVGATFCFSNFNKEYMSKENTSCIKGIFILIVFYSHFMTYSKINYTKDFFMLETKNFLGQLMVAMFLFYSGYGIYESIKAKKQSYVKSIPKNRILKTWFHFAVAVLSNELFLF